MLVVCICGVYKPVLTSYHPSFWDLLLLPNGADDLSVPVLLEPKQRSVVRVSKTGRLWFYDQEMIIHFPYYVCVLVTSKSVMLNNFTR